MTQRLLEGGHSVVVYDRNPAAEVDAIRMGGINADSLQDITLKLETPRVVWVMIPAGPPVEQTIADLVPHLSPGDILIDGGNSNFKDTKRRAATLVDAGIHMLDAGTSGGIWGLKNGYCLMVGGPQEAFKHAESIFKTLAPENGYAHVGPSGAGHYAKMIHNGIEYGMLQAIGEGFEILQNAEFDFDLDQLCALWNQGSVIRSWLLELAQRAFAQEEDLDTIRDYVEDSGEGRWTVLEAMEKNVPAPVLTLSLLMRFRSRQDESFSAKVIAALRSQFGGHAVQRESHND
jgi:6-phosphogluconate dehydrogenase